MAPNFLQALEASAACQTSVMTDLAARLRVLNANGAKPFVSEQEET